MNARKYGLIVLASLIIFMLASCSGNDEGKIVVSGKNYTEQLILSQIMGEHLKANTDLEVDIKDGLSTIFVLHEAMKKGEIDMYVEYTGTSYENILNETYDQTMTPDDIYEKTKAGYEEEFNFTLLEPLGFNNTYVLIYREELNAELGIDTYSELVEHSSELSLGSDASFFERSDGFKGLVETYGYDFADDIIIDPDLGYRAAQNGEIDVVTATSTDARIDQFNLKALEDDKKFFPPYDAVVVIRQEVLDENPGLEKELNKLSGLFNDERMRELNGRVNLDGKKVKDVALEFLEEEGLLD